MKCNYRLIYISTESLHQEMDNHSVKPLKITAQSYQNNIKIYSQTDDFSWQIRNPLQSVLATLAGCELSITKRIAKKKNIQIKSMKFTKIQSAYQLQRLAIGGPDNRINDIFIECEVETTGTQQDLDQIREQALNFCPIYQMLTKADVKINNQWKNIQVNPNSEN